VARTALLRESSRRRCAAYATVQDERCGSAGPLGRRCSALQSLGRWLRSADVAGDVPQCCIFLQRRSGALPCSCASAHITCAGPPHAVYSTNSSVKCANAAAAAYALRAAHSRSAQHAVRRGALYDRLAHRSQLLGRRLQCHHSTKVKSALDSLANVRKQPMR
jgi:hypothetical protein